MLPQLHWSPSAFGGLVLSVSWVLSVAVGSAQETPPPVADVRFEGAVQTTNAYLRNVIRLRSGDPLDQKVIDADVVRLLQTGKFLSVHSSTESLEEGTVVTYHLRERPTITAIRFVGNAAVKDRDLEDQVRLHAGDPVDAFGVQEGRDNILQLYRRKGYGRATVETDRALLQTTGELVYRIEEGPKVRVRKVLFEGNRTVESKELQRHVRTKPAAWIFRIGRFDADQAAVDAIDLQNFYRDEGYLDARASYRVDPGAEPGDLRVVFTIVEGVPYTIESVAVQGNTVLTTDEILSMTASKPGDVVKQRKLDEDSEAIETAYHERGYIYARVRPIRVFSATPERVVVTMQIEEGERIKVGRIVVRGNETTQDKVVRRALNLFPGEPFNLTEAREAERRLRATQIFERAAVTPVGDTPGVRDIIIDVEETKAGGNFIFAVGVTSNSGLVGSIILDLQNFDIFDVPRSFSEFIKFRSFHGAGQRMRIELQPGTDLNRFRIDFTEPYLFDQPIRFGTGLYLFTRGREAYDETRTGGNISFGRRLEHGLGDGEFFKDWYGEVAFRAEQVDVDDVDIFDHKSVREVEGNSILTSFKGTLVRDRTDSRFRPTQGYRFTISYEQFAGDFTFGKLRSKYTRHRTVYVDEQERKSVLSWNVDLGVILGEAPLYEKLYAGGIGSIRGFDFRGVGPRGGLINRDPIGGDFSLTTTVEYTIPLYGDMLQGVAFLDMGTVEEDISISSWRASVGVGVRLTLGKALPFFGPLPMEFDFAIPVASDEEDDERVFSFYIGGNF